ncbi:hypothetical protein F5H01DRAFT_182857 [Linnemannia elongata]|nr:hypothetical protein F5H01DRAFT_182857 [Linnemannia elongata]
MHSLAGRSICIRLVFLFANTHFPSYAPTSSDTRVYKRKKESTLLVRVMTLVVQEQHQDGNMKTQSKQAETSRTLQSTLDFIQFSTATPGERSVSKGTQRLQESNKDTPSFWDRIVFIC